MAKVSTKKDFDLLEDLMPISKDTYNLALKKLTKSEIKHYILLSEDDGVERAYSIEGKGNVNKLRLKSVKNENQYGIDHYFYFEDLGLA